MTTSSGASETGYGYSSAEADHTASYLWPSVERAARQARGFDLDCFLRTRMDVIVVNDTIIQRSAR